MSDKKAELLQVLTATQIAKDVDGMFLDMHESVIECLRVHSAHDCSVD
jgi:hypothetical protein